MTQNVPPGIDFSNDPLLQGRNFSYLDTQIKRLGGPNFTHIPINAPRCPFAHFQQDGHMAMRNPKGRVNYEPNIVGRDGGPRENPDARLPHLPGGGGGPEGAAASGELRRPLQPGAAVLHQPDADRAEAHRRRAGVRAEQGRAAGHSRAHGLAPAQHRRRSRRDGRRRPRRRAARSRPSPRSRPATISSRRTRSASSCNGPKSFEGRKLGILLTDGADAKTLHGAGEQDREAGRRRRGHRAEDRRRDAVGSHGCAGEAEDRWRAVGALRRRGDHRVRGRRGAAGERCAIQRTSSPTPSRTASSSATARRSSLCSSKPASPTISTLAASCSTKDGVGDFVDALGELRFWNRELNVDLDAAGD